ncbi:unnamed protein product, partial [Rotaria magnacalcarata]
DHDYQKSLSAAHAQMERRTRSRCELGLLHGAGKVPVKNGGGEAACESSAD